MDTVRVKNRNKFLLGLHHLLPLPPSRPCCLWCETHNEPLSVPSELSEAMMCHPCRALLSEANVCVQKKGLSPVSPLATGG